MTITAENTTFEGLKAQVAKTMAKRRKPQDMDADALIERMKYMESTLVPYIGKKATTDWVFNGFDIDVDENAASTLPITASLKFNHKTLSGFDEAQAWGQSGSEECFEWLQGLGFPVFEVDLTME